jgi:hypothetical protein
MSIAGRRTLFVGLLLIALLPSAARAQRWDVTGLVGVGMPVSDLGDAYDPGLSATLSTTRWFGPRFGIRFGGAGNFLPGANSLIPDTSFWHYNVGPEIDLIDPAKNLGLHVHAGVGATTSQADGRDDSTDFTVNLGATIEYKVSPAWSIIGGPSFYIIAADETGYILPISAGFRYFFGTH